ncbi:transposase (plasmid) [Nostoc sp. NIES-2111]|nr:transposase [Nostoc sp. NIES-2111]
MSQHKHKAGTLSSAIDNFIKTTHSYWSGLFHCYEIEDFPRTNNDLEHTFGMLRHHQRRCTGRKVAPSSLVIRGSVKLACAFGFAVAEGIATKLHSFTASDLAQVDIHTWLELRSHLQKHHQARIEQYRFRRDPKAYLANLESRLL